MDGQIKTMTRAKTHTTCLIIVYVNSNNSQLMANPQEGDNDVDGALPGSWQKFEDVSVVDFGSAVDTFYQFVSQERLKFASAFGVYRSNRRPIFE